MTASSDRRPDELALLTRWLSAFSSASSGRGPGVLLGPGDDAAALALRPGKVMVATTDALIDRVHFDARVFPAPAVGHKALAVNLSDIAAMGATPRFVLVSLVVPEDLPTRFLMGAARGMAALCEASETSLVGGNISAGPRLAFHLTLLGEVAPARLLRRSGARVGDGVWVSGTLGDAALGLASLRGLQRPPRSPSRLQARQLRPTPRLALGQALAREALATACLDISDGLALDLRRLLEASGVGARIALSRLPRSPAARRVLASCRDPFAPLVAGGEDYELLFTVPPSKASALQAWACRHGEAVCCIGEIVRAPGLHFVLPDGGRYRPPREGHRHLEAP